MDPIKNKYIYIFIYSTQINSYIYVFGLMQLQVGICLGGVAMGGGGGLSVVLLQLVKLICFKNNKKEYSSELHSIIFDGCILLDILKFMPPGKNASYATDLSRADTGCICLQLK